MTRWMLALLCLCMLSAAVDPNNPFGSATIEDRPGAAIPMDRPFRTADGTATTLRTIAAGRPLLVTPVLHECPNICGVTLAGLADAIGGQQRFTPGIDFAVVALGIDPREGPAEARSDMERLSSAQRARPKIEPVALTGSAESIHAVTDALGYRYAWDDRIGQYAHVAATAVLTPDGRLSSWLYGLAPRPDDVAKALDDAAAGRTGSLVEQILLLCYHYDPETGQYSLVVARVVQIAGLFTVLVLGLLIFLLARRRRDRK